MRAINLPHFKLKLPDVSRELYIEHGWHMPPGLVNSAERDPRNFTRAEWQQAKRADHDPAILKETFQDCWAISDSRKAFAQALAARGLYLARGDRRGFVAVDIKGEVFAIARWTGLKTKIVEARLGDPDDLPSVAQTKAQIADLLKGVLGRHLAETEAEYKARLQPVQKKQARLHSEQRRKRSDLQQSHMVRAIKEAQDRAARYRRGLRGLWDRLTGRHSQTRRENEANAAAALRRDAAEHHTLVQEQLGERRTLQNDVKALRLSREADISNINREIAKTDDPGASLGNDIEVSRSPHIISRKRSGPVP